MNRNSKFLLCTFVVVVCISSSGFSMEWIRSLLGLDEQSRAIAASKESARREQAARQELVAAEARAIAASKRSFDELRARQIQAEMDTHPVCFFNKDLDDKKLKHQAPDPVDVLIQKCDAMHLDKGIFMNNAGTRNISQIPCLFQAFPGITVNLCGYYAAYFALCMLTSRSPDELKGTLNDRGRFERYLQRWSNFIKTERDRYIADLPEDMRAEFAAAGEMLMADQIKSIFENHLADEVRPESVIVDGNDKFDSIIAAFKSQEHPADLCFILNTKKEGSHWIAVWVSKDKGMIIADSMATNRTDFEKIIKLYDDIFGATK
ncbi:MAG: hypothetical protein US49_C0002G0155 [candidate division TM6 bacterium GW2011_GWF2_37_49]|nr:MAG: hypothetical protein US49_C0002G0155 [candidate division TM6 bacterium GW2011_GWF2_37_49]